MEQKQARPHHDEIRGTFGLVVSSGGLCWPLRLFLLFLCASGRGLLSHVTNVPRQSVSAGRQGLRRVGLKTSDAWLRGPGSCSRRLLLLREHACVCVCVAGANPAGASRNAVYNNMSCHICLPETNLSSSLLFLQKQRPFGTTSARAVFTAHMTCLWPSHTVPRLHCCDEHSTAMAVTH